MPKFVFLYFSPRKKTMQTVTKSKTIQTQVYQGKKKYKYSLENNGI